MTLESLCAPLFRYVGVLNRAGLHGTRHEPSKARVELENIFNEMREKAASNRGLALQYERIELPLIFFVDFMIKGVEMARERRELAGDDKFFDLLEDTLAEKSSEASERLVIFYTCLGMGFAGRYASNPEIVRQKMLDCAARLGSLIDSGSEAAICPEAYEHVNTSDLIEPPVKSLGAVGVALAGLVVVVFVVNFLLFRRYSSDLHDALDRITAYAPWVESGHEIAEEWDRSSS